MLVLFSNKLKEIADQKYVLSAVDNIIVPPTIDM